MTGEQPNPPGTDRTCSTCGALPGETCIRPNGKELRHPHAERR